MLTHQPTADSENARLAASAQLRRSANARPTAAHCSKLGNRTPCPVRRRTSAAGLPLRVTRLRPSCVRAGIAPTAKLVLIDALGRTVRTKVVALPGAGQRHELDLVGLPAGLYALRVEAEGTTTTRQLVVE